MTAYVVASDRAWGKSLYQRMKQSSGDTWHLFEERGDLTAENLSRLNPRYLFLPHWSHRIPPEIFEKFECVIFHMTDLPFGRGGSPLQNLIVRGYSETMMTALRCIAELDAGPVYLKRPLSLLGTADEIFLRASDVVGQMIDYIIEHEPEPVPQEGEPVTFARRQERDGDISKLGSLEQVYDYIRMLDGDGYPPAFLDVGCFRIEFSRATLKPDRILVDVTIRTRDNKR